MTKCVIEEILLDILWDEIMSAKHPGASGGTFPLRQTAYFMRKDELLPSSSQLQALEELLPGNDPETQRQVVTLHLRRVVNIAKRYVSYGLALPDLLREGMDGLIHALKKFDLEGSFSFPTYARQCIRHSIENAIISRLPLPSELQAALAR